jgi:hypothetical protein
MRRLVTRGRGGACWTLHCALGFAVLALLAGLVPSGHQPPGHASHPGRPAAAVAQLADYQIPAASGGLCSVPGIGDIGGLLGLCNLGSSGLTGALNNICQPSLPDPEPADSGIDSMIKPPAARGQPPATLYDRYGVAGQFWAATNLQCSDMTSLIGNNVAGIVFDVAKSVDRVTITVYQSAAGESILGWLQAATDRLVSALGNAIYFPYLAVAVILGAIWLAWQGLIRKRGTRTIEGTVWMVIACAAAIWLIGRPADFTGAGKSVSDGISEALDAAFARLPAPHDAGCVPQGRTDPQGPPRNYSYTSGSAVVDTNAGELWSVLVCKPWLAGEFGTTAFSSSPGAAATPVNRYARQLLWAQAVASNEKPTTALIKAKQATYAGIAKSLQQHDPAVYPLFQGKQWTTRLEIGFAALFAAVVAGVLILLIAVTLIVLKLGFLLLLIVGPFFLLVGTHPGAGRIIALRWLEMLAGVLLKQAAIALVLSLLLYAYSLIMGTSEAVLPWALKILMIALVTVAVFIYRKPFQHLFSAVGYGIIGVSEPAQASLDRAVATGGENSTDAATVAVPGFAAYRAARWARRNPGQAVALAAVAAGAGGVGARAALGGLGAKADTADGAGGPVPAAGIAEGSGESSPRAGLAGVSGSFPREGIAAGTAAGAAGRPRREEAEPSAGADGDSPARAGAVAARARAGTAAGNRGTPPPLRLPGRDRPGDSRAIGGAPPAAARNPARAVPVGAAPRPAAAAALPAARESGGPPSRAGGAGGSSGAGSPWSSARRSRWPDGHGMAGPAARGGASPAARGPARAPNGPLAVPARGAAVVASARVPASTAAPGPPAAAARPVGPSGPWFSAGQRAAPPAAPDRSLASPGPPPAVRASDAPALPLAGPKARRADGWPARAGTAPPLPVRGSPDPGEDGAPRPFWLRPVWRRR